MLARRTISLVIRSTFLRYDRRVHIAGVVPQRLQPINLTPPVGTFATITNKDAVGKSLLDETTYNEISDKFLEDLQEKLQTLEQAGIDDFDIEYGHGVLTLRLGAKGTYVLNKQAPNKQIWWSSPISGPKRFNLDTTTGAWVNTRDLVPLTKELEEELKKLCNIDIKL